MKIIIVGVGKLGAYLAKQLVDEDHEVTLVDNSFSAKEDIINNLDVNYVEGNGLDSNILIEANVVNADILISVMNKDEQNLMCSLIGKKLGAKHTIARIRTLEYSNSINLLKEDLGLSMVINPEMMMASSIARTLNIPSAIDATTFLKGRIEVIALKIKEKSKLDKVSVDSISKKFGANIKVFAIERVGDTIIPDGSTKLLIGDKIYISGTRKDINAFLKVLGLISEKTKKVLIIGGSSVCVYLSKILIDLGMAVRIIEMGKERCNELSSLLPKALIINGDASSEKVLYEAGIDECDAFVSLTSIDEENIVYSMFASLQKVPKIITKVNHIKLNGLIEKSNIDAVVAPHKVAANQVVRYVRALQNRGGSSCLAVYKYDNVFEMTEFSVLNDFKAINVKIKDLKLKKGILIGVIRREKNIIFPTGNDVIQDKDEIVVINKNKKLKDINDILE